MEVIKKQNNKSKEIDLSDLTIAIPMFERPGFLLRQIHGAKQWLLTRRCAKKRLT